MPRPFFDFLCDLKADQAASASSDASAQPQALASQLRQLRTLISTRRTPIPALRSSGWVPPESSLDEVDRLLSFGFDQPCRTCVSEQKDLENLRQMVSQCISRHFSNARVVVNPGASKNSELGRTVVPVNVKVITKTAGSPSLDLRLDRLSRDIEMAT